MSDFEDDMDIDGPALADKDAITFSADNTGSLAKGKRIAVDLPVEAEDNLPWYIYPLYSIHRYINCGEPCMVANMRLEFKGREIPS